MARYTLWTVEQTARGLSEPDEQELPEEWINDWVSECHASVPGSHNSWTTEVLRIRIHPQDLLASDNIRLVTDITRCGLRPFKVFSTSNKIKFRSFSSLDPPTRLELSEHTQSYSVSDICFGVCCIWNPYTRHTKCVMYFLGNEGQNLMEGLLNRIRDLHKLRAHPFLLAMLMLESKCMSMQIFIEREASRLLSIHIQMGYHAYHDSRSIVEKEGKAEYKEFLTQWARKANGHAVNAAGSVLNTQTLLGLADFILANRLRVLTRLRRGSEACLSLAKEIEGLDEDIEQYTQNLKQQVQDSCNEADSGKYSASTTVETIFTRFAQKDQEISLHLATQTTKDSTSMKSIAAVTLCFLPGTFIAAMFAMPMFSFHVEPNAIVSGQFWLYWAVTIPLTLVVIATWFLWIKYNDRHDPDHLQAPPV